MMKKVLFSFLTALIASAGSLPMAAQEAYAVLTEPDSTLTLYYDNLRSTRPGTKYDITPEEDTVSGWRRDYTACQEKIKHAVFDASFADYRPTSTRFLFQSCVKLQDIKDIRNLNTANVTDMRDMFCFCSSLASLDLTNFNTANVTDMTGMFESCSSLTSLNLSNFNTEKVTMMSSMFSGCNSLASLDLTGFNTANVTDMDFMFAGCSSLTTIYCNDDWSVGGKVEFYRDMFSNCPNLKGDGAAYDPYKTGIEMANPTTGYFTTKTTTGIDHVTAAGKVCDGKIYDLSGRLVGDSYQGIVIKDGRKVVQR